MNTSNENLGIIDNTTEIFEATNDYGLSDIDSEAGNKVEKEDDYSYADVLLSIRTGFETARNVIIIVAIIGIIALIAYFNVKDKKDKEKNHKRIIDTK